MNLICGSPVAWLRVMHASQGIDKNLANQARRLGALPDERFEAAVADARDRVTNAAEHAIKRQQRDALAAEIGGGNKPLPKGKYAVIYADPLWRFQLWSDKGEPVAANHYPMMTQQEIEALPIASLAGKDCALFLWAMPQLPEALAVIEAWGFQNLRLQLGEDDFLDGTRPRHGMGY